MIGSRLGLAVLAAVAALLAIVLALDIARAHTPPRSRALIPPDVAVDRIDALTWTRDGEPAMHAARTKSSAWRVDVAAPPAPIDPQALDAILSALRTARWHREAPASAAGAIHSTLAFGDVAIGFGAKLGADQQWLTVGDRALLVDAWVVRALDPTALELVQRAPFTAQRDLAAHLAGGAELVVDLAAGRERAPSLVALAPERLAAIHDALDHIVLVHLEHPATATATATGAPASPMTLTVGDARVELGEPCADAPELVAIHGSANGCIERTAWDALTAALAAVAGEPATIADPRPIAAAPTEIDFGDGDRLELARTPVLQTPDGAQAVEPARALALVSALTAPAAIVALPSPTSPPRRTLTVHVAGAPPTIVDVYAAVVVRRGEPVALRPDRAALAAMTAPVAELREATLWLEDASAIAAIQVDGTTYTRGAVLGEWTSPTKPDSLRSFARTLEQLAVAVAAPRASPGDPPPPHPPNQHFIAIEIRSPLGEATRRTMFIARIDARCAVYADGRAAWIDSRACAAAPDR